MAQFEVIMPKLGESIIEATITRWIKKPGDTIEEDDPIVEIATDKVDSEIPSPVEGKLIEVKYNEGDVVDVGKVIAIIETEPGAAEEQSKDTPQRKEETATISNKPEYAENQADGGVAQPKAEKAETKQPAGTNADAEAKAGETKGKAEAQAEEAEAQDEGMEVQAKESLTQSEDEDETESDRFYSPLVKNIAKAEGITGKELEKVKGTGKEGRVTKNDLLSYLEQRGQQPEKSAEPQKQQQPQADQAKAAPKTSVPSTAKPAPPVTAQQGDEIIEMDRMRKLIADHMVMSKQVSPHVTSFIEVDVTNMVMWREKVKDEFLKREKEKITFTPIFVEAATQAIKELPGVNASVDGYNVILRKNINIGIAAALPNGNLIVPVIKNSDQKSLLGLAKDVNSLADKARKGKLEPDDIQGGTFTITNLGTFGSITGSPIINQPQVAILGLGVIKKKPVVLETEHGDVIAIRHIVILSLAYDHRVVDGALGGKFLQKMQQILESFDTNRTI